MSTHKHAWKLALHLDGCHYYTSVYNCECGATLSTHDERDFANDPWSSAWVISDCPRCRELTHGAEPRHASEIQEPSEPTAHARHSDPWTSHAAAQSIPPEKLRASQRAVLECFSRHGAMHHNELVATYSREYRDAGWPQQSVSGLRTRTHELVDLGLLRNSGSVVRLPSRRKSIVWEPA
jgi:hypothetical protein